ncbi:KAP family P-loop NTPase fold protein [Priestia megaterium]|uniref:KAP family P-loop NTPase fold protein n=1 Tax=Priestia megaterium TaxID=1404 RepID=UPI0005C6522A|nr:P-loop NTPase fold protein [Priestia megaterium]
MIYNNRPYAINENSDLFGTFFKADAIKNILENSIDYFDNNNLVALYGEWGSGKTSVMEYIKSTTSIYNVVFFEAWRYEKDSNLSLSLFEMLIDKFEDEKELLGDILEDAKLTGKALLSFVKNSLLNYKIVLPGIHFNIDQAAKDTLNEMDKLIERTSFYTTFKDFNTSYNELLDKYYEVTGKKLLVFIDDLDRCAPENVLDLISGIKNFFTNSDKVVYFCGVDKHSVSKAIDIRYRNIVKAEEYLEKVFDVTFNMPENRIIDNILMDFIDRVSAYDIVPEYNFDILREFFLSINFTNPRKIKKLFNKYLLLCTLDKSNSTKVYKSIPDNFNKHEPIQMVFTLFFILLHEFNRENFDFIYNSDSRVIKLRNNLKLDTEIFLYEGDSGILFEEYLYDLEGRWNHKHFYVSSEHLNTTVLREDNNLFFELILLFAPLDIKATPPSFDASQGTTIYEHLSPFVNQFEASEEKILSSFISYIVDLDTPDNDDHHVLFNVYMLMDMVNLYL